MRFGYRSFFRLLAWLGNRLRRQTGASYGQSHQDPKDERGSVMTYRVILEHRGGRRQVLGDFATRKGAMICIDQYRIDDEGHDEYWRLLIKDGDRAIYIHKSTNHIVDMLSEEERRSGRILAPHD